MAVWRVSCLAEFMLSLQPCLKGRFHLGQLFELRWEHTSWTPRHQQEYLLRVFMRAQYPLCTLYSNSCLFPSSWGSAWRFFSVSDTTGKSLKSSTRFSSSAFGIARCTLTPKAEMELTCHFHYICDQLFFIAGDLFELRQTDKQLQ